MDLRLYFDLLSVAGAAVAAVAAIAFARRSRADRGTIAGLERAFTGHRLELPGIAFSSTMQSATTGARVGGDLVDVFGLDARYAMILVADVSGKGVDAAAQTAFIKYTIRTLALESDGDPAVIVAKFNAMYRHTVTADEAFVVLILGIIDSQTGDVRYASAGHEPAFVRRASGAIRQLAPTGPVVGVSPFSAYRTDCVSLTAGDVLVWTTDGLTESRDRQRRLLGVDGLAAWIAAAPRDVVDIAASLDLALHERCGSRINDDAAVLAVAYCGPPAASATRASVAERYEAMLVELRHRRARQQHE